VYAVNQDAEGYYVPRIGEIIQDKYQVTSIAGKGAFSCVVKARNLAYKNELTAKFQSKASSGIVNSIQITNP
jgi:hypothetical protein